MSWLRRSTWLTRAWLIGMAVLLALVLVPVNHREPTVVRLEGSTTIGLDLAPALISAYLVTLGVPAAEIRKEEQGGSIVVEGTPPGFWQRPIRFEVGARGTRTAFDPADPGIDIGMASRPVTEVEESALGRGTLRYAPAIENVIGSDGVAVVVSAGRTVPALGVDQLRAVFACPEDTDDWAELLPDGPGGPIRIFSPGPDSGTFELFRERVLGDEQLCPAATILPSGAAVAQAVDNMPDSIGIVSLAQIGDLATVPIFQDDSQLIVANRFTVSTGSYLLSRRLYLYLYPEPAPQPVAAGLTAYALSEAGRDVVDDLGFVAAGRDYPDPQAAAAPVSDGEPADAVPVPPACADPPEYPAFVSGAVRRSTDLRFRTNETQLDTLGAQDVVSIGRELGGTADPPEVLVVGFADANGTPEVNLRVSRERAQAAVAELDRNGLAGATPMWFGEACPVDSNLSEAGRERNRRVEIWIRR